MDKIVACWHHGSEERLKKCLREGYCDLHPVAEKCPKGRMSAEAFFYGKLRLRINDPVRFSVKGRIVATGIIASAPYDFFERTGRNPIDPKWPGAVNIEKFDDTKWLGLDTNQRCVDPAGKFGSHRLKDC